MNRKERRAIMAKAKKDKKVLGKHFSTGYTGQDYEVLCTYNKVSGYKVGWTNDPSGGKLVKLIELHPEMEEPVVRKLSDEDKARLAG